MGKIKLIDALKQLDLDAIAFAYISAALATITILAGTYYRVAGTFTNEVLNKFIIDPVSFNLEYSGSRKQKFDIVVNASISSDTVNTTVTMGLEKNGILETNSLMTVKLVQTTDVQIVSFNDLVELENGDEVEIVMMSDKAGAQITANTMTTKARAEIHI